MDWYPTWLLIYDKLGEDSGKDWKAINPEGDQWKANENHPIHPIYE